MKWLILCFLIIFSDKSFAQGKFFGGNGDGFSSITLSNVVLPLTLIDLAVGKKNNTVEIAARMNADTKSVKLVLEKSTNGTDFASIDSMDHTTLLMAGRSVLFLDPTPSNGMNYYRVQLSGAGLTTIISETKSIRFYQSEKAIFRVVAGTLYYNADANTSFRLLNGNGQLIIEQKIKAGAGSVLLPALSKGIYFISVGTGASQAIWLGD